MIITEYYLTRFDGVILNKTYSDAGYYIVRDGIEYTEAVDPAELQRTYTESTRKIEINPVIERQKRSRAYQDSLS